MQLTAPTCKRRPRANEQSDRWRADKCQLQEIANLEDDRHSFLLHFLARLPNKAGRIIFYMSKAICLLQLKCSPNVIHVSGPSTASVVWLWFDMQVPHPFPFFQSVLYNIELRRGRDIQSSGLQECSRKFEKPTATNDASRQQTAAENSKKRSKSFAYQRLRFVQNIF